MGENLQKIKDYCVSSFL